MPGTTTNGLPYPINTDRLTDGAAKIQELAEAVDARLLANYTIVPATWQASTTNPNKGATGICDIGVLKRGHIVEFALKLFLQGAGVSLGNGNYSFTLPYAPIEFDRFSYAGITGAPNRQYTAKITAAGNLILYKNGQTTQYDHTQAGTDGWAAGTNLAISGSYLTNA